MVITSFEQKLVKDGLQLKRDVTTAMQINVGRICDLSCRHCHLEAGPMRRESMSLKTAEDVITCARRFKFSSIDITGGAPEYNPNLPLLVGELAGVTQKLIVRTNLTALERVGYSELVGLYQKKGVVLVASLPAVNSSQTEAQRGAGVWDTCIEMLQKLNSSGYGCEGSGLELDLVSSPAGAYLPANQAQSEKRFHSELLRKYGINFNRLFTFANVPLGRFKQWLESSGNYNRYVENLTASFNHLALPGLMCRSLVSVDWDGIVYDCDFNLAAGLPHSGERLHISEMVELPHSGSDISVGDHCYACTAGAGFT